MDRNQARETEARRLELHPLQGFCQDILDLQKCRKLILRDLEIPPACRPFLIILCYFRDLKLSANGP